MSKVHQAVVATGDPLEKRATFTRFLVPFRYVLPLKARSEPNSSTTPTLNHFKESEDDDWIHAPKEGSVNRANFLDEARRRYCTLETSELLYQRARWFVLDTGKKAERHWKKPLLVPSGLQNASHYYEVALRPPALVLFEASGKPSPKNAKADVMRIGFLVLEAYFTGRRKQKDRDDPTTLDIKPPFFEDLLRFNEIFRYVRCPYEKHRGFCGAELQAVHNGIFSDGAPGLKDAPGDIYERKWLEWLQCPVADLGPVVPLTTPATSLSELLAQPDDRAFTQSAVFFERTEQECKADEVAPTSAPYRIASGFVPGKSPIPAMAGHWVKFVNIDGIYAWPLNEKACSAFEFQWADLHTYKRWAHDGTLYGFTPHSFALLSAATPGGGHAEPELALHAGQLYFDLTLLLLYIRCALFRFSGELHEISCAARDHGETRDKKEWQESFNRLRWEFMLFENLYQWPLLSNQQQHLEIYDIQRRTMDAQELYEEIRKEIASSDEVLNNLLNEKRNARAERLNEVAYFGLIFSVFLTGIGVFFSSISTLGKGIWPGRPHLPPLWTIHTGCLVVMGIFVVVLAWRGRRIR